MKMIASADNNWAIGYKGQLLAHVSGDMKFFKSKTVGNVVILGRKTLETFPGKKPLKDRENIIITSNKDFTAEGASVVHSVEELLEYVKKYDSDSLYVIGGASVYAEHLKYCDTAYITRFYDSFEADTFIENLDKAEGWRLSEAGDIMEEKGIKYRFCTYVREKL